DNAEVDMIEDFILYTSLYPVLKYGLLTYDPIHPDNCPLSLHDALPISPKPGDGALKLDGMETYVDPRVEWNQMYHEVWRIERDFLYDPNLHGLNLAATEKKYSVYLKGDRKSVV